MTINIANKSLTIKAGQLHFLIAMLFCFVVPFEPEFERIRVRVFAVMPLFVIPFLRKLDKANLILAVVAAIVMPVLALFSKEEYATFVLGFSLVLYLLLLSEISKFHKRKNLSLLVGILCIIFLLQINLHPADRIRAQTSIGDPNFSSYYLLLLFFLANKVNNKIAVIFTILIGIVFLSKNYYLAILVFYVCMLFKSSLFKISEKFKLKTGLYLLITHAIVIGMGVYVSYLHPEYTTQSSGVSRLVNISNPSDFLRLKLNVDALREVFSNINSFVSGFDLNYFHSRYGNVPHNSLLYNMLRHGVVFTGLLFIAIVRVINKEFNKENLPYILSYMVFGLFLHSNYWLFGMILFYYLISMEFIQGCRNDTFIRNTMFYIIKPIRPSKG